MSSESFLHDVAQIVDTAQKFKAKMMEKGITRARTACPRCKAKNPDKPSGATLYGFINGARDHFSMNCRNGCGFSMME